jgi:protein TonB
MSFDKSEALRKAEQHSLKGEISAAITVYRKIVETDPYDFNSINKLGDLYVGAGRIKDAISEFSRIADLHLTNGSATRAAYLLKKTLELDPSNAPVRMKLGDVYSRENMVESAHEAFVQAGSAFMRSGDIHRALEANQKALAIKPDSQQAKAAIATLEHEAASNESKRSLDQAKSGSPGPGTVSESDARGAKQKQATGTLDHLLSGYDDDFVVHRISKAEALVGFGQVPEAVSMLEEVLHSAPDNIAIHIKLKDIYLRAEMMDEACVEYKELARICAARGETARAKDYEVRAQRLSRMIAAPAFQPEAQASASAKRVEPQPVVSNGNGSNDEKSSVTRRASEGVQPAIDDIGQAGEKVTAAAVARQASSPKPRVETQTVDDLFNSAGKLSVQVNETALASVAKPVQALQVSAPASPNSFPAASVLGLELVETDAQPSVERKRRRWLYATPIIVICLAAIAVSVIKGFSLYDARLNKQYEELIRASSLNSLPGLPQMPAFDESENADGDVVTLGPQPTQDVKASESATDQPEARVVESKLAAEPKAAPVLSSEPPKASRPSALSPPLISPALDDRAGTDGNSPGGMSARVPEHATGAAPMPALPTPPRKTSVTIPGEALRRVQPTYPLSAKSARQGGAVSVEVVINENGDVISARAVSGSDLLKNAAVSAAKGWKFKPSTRDGKPVKSTSTITFNFKM